MSLDISVVRSPHFFLKNKGANWPPPRRTPNVHVPPFSRAELLYNIVCCSEKAQSAPMCWCWCLLVMCVCVCFSGSSFFSMPFNCMYLCPNPEQQVRSKAKNPSTSSQTCSSEEHVVRSESSQGAWSHGGPVVSNSSGKGGQTASSVTVAGYSERLGCHRSTRGNS